MSTQEVLFRGKRLDTGQWAESRSPDGVLCFGSVIYLFQPGTVGQYTGMKDRNWKNIFEGDIVEFFGMRGEIVQECGAFGIGCRRLIDYDLLESKIPHNNSAYFCHNDNFISLWELWWNYEQDDNPLFEVEIIGNRWDNPRLLREA